MTAEEADVEENRPGAQIWHCVWPVLSFLLPGKQSLQTIAPLSEPYLPGAQSVQLVALNLSDHVPLGHSMHGRLKEKPSGEIYLPIPHETQVARLEGS